MCRFCCRVQRHKTDTLTVQLEHSYGHPCILLFPLFLPEMIQFIYRLNYLYFYYRWIFGLVNHFIHLFMQFFVQITGFLSYIIYKLHIDKECLT